MNKADIKKKLALLSQDKDSFADPFAEKESTDLAIIIPEEIKMRARKSYVGDLVDDYLSNRKGVLGDEVDGFDSILEDCVHSEEDTALRNSLISMGRKYARDFGASEDTSEVSKAFALQEKLLHDMIGDADTRLKDVEQEIKYQLTKRTAKDIRAISELIGSRTGVDTLKLNAIKALSDIAKNKFDIRMKLSKESADNEDISQKSASLLQQLFSIGPENIVSSVGGRNAVAGAYSEQEPLADYQNEMDSNQYLNDDNLKEDDDEMSDDRFIQYDDRDIKLVLCIEHDSKRKYVIAEDENGNPVPDFPIPDIKDLEFSIDDSIMEASDQLFRTYKLRYV